MAMQLTHKKYVNFQFSYVINGLHLKYIKYKFISCENSPILYTILPRLHVCPGSFKRLDACVLSLSLSRVSWIVYRYRHTRSYTFVHIYMHKHKMPFELFCFNENASICCCCCCCFRRFCVAITVVACIMHVRASLARSPFLSLLIPIQTFSFNSSYMILMSVPFKQDVHSIGV